MRTQTHGRPNADRRTPVSAFTDTCMQKERHEGRIYTCSSTHTQTQQESPYCVGALWVGGRDQWPLALSPR